MNRGEDPTSQNRQVRTQERVLCLRLAKFEFLLIVVRTACGGGLRYAHPTVSSRCALQNRVHPVDDVRSNQGAASGPAVKPVAHRLPIAPAAQEHPAGEP